LEVVADRFHPPAQAVAQEGLGHRIEGFAVFRPAEAMAFVG